MPVLFKLTSTSALPLRRPPSLPGPELHGRAGPASARWLALAAALCALSASGVAQTGSAGQRIYRCDSHYSDQPCTNARVIDAADTVSGQRRREAERVAQGDQALLARWRRERAIMEREAGSGLAGLGTSPMQHGRDDARSPPTHKADPSARRKRTATKPVDDHARTGDESSPAPRSTHASSPQPRTRGR